MKLAVIGSGLLGSTTAFLAGSKGLFREIYLIGRRQNVVQSHVLDMDMTMRALSDTRIYTGDYDCLSSCDIILLAASKPERKVESRNEYLQENLALVHGILEKIAAHCENKAILTATNPIDIFNYINYQTLGWDRRHFLGYSYNDTMRLRWALADTMGEKYSAIEAYVLGEHGDLQVPVFEHVFLHGKPYAVPGEQKARALEIISAYFRSFQALDAQRTAGWTSSVGMTAVLEAMVHETDEIFPCSAVLQGEYGEHNVSAGVPVRLCRQGIREIVELPLLNETKKQFAHTANELRARIPAQGAQV
ncbi:hypothetical protein LJC07_07940 [Christensenellaceae bacterium OttesenSCG-928-L17]|nr:hypothetical protein [Christensenellaceae bacterium OttesenSCG-928-L17]